jgi:arylsulfatase A-like enzyme
MTRLLTLAALFALAAPLNAADRPNVLVVLSDDHSVPHVGCYGNKDIKTPNLDRFAGEGMRFDRAYVTCPQCVPSRASIMTGRSPVAIQMTRFAAPLPAEVPIFPELLKAAGYYAGVAGRTYHLDGPGAARMPPEMQRAFEKYGLVTFPKRLDYVKQGGRPQVLVQFRESLDRVPAGKPFVLQLCSPDPHRPLDADAIPQPHDPTKLTLPPWYADTKLVREDFARYYDEIARFDGDFGQIMGSTSTACTCRCSSAGRGR